MLKVIYLGKFDLISISILDSPISHTISPRLIRHVCKTVMFHKNFEHCEMCRRSNEENPNEGYNFYIENEGFP